MKNPSPIQVGIGTFMRIAFAQLLLATTCSALCFAHESTGQQILQKKVSLTAENEAIASVLRKIERQASITFTYNEEVIKDRRTVSVRLDSVRLSEALDAIFNHKVSYEAINAQIILRLSKRASMSAERTGYSYAVLLDVSGRVTDENAMPLPGVNVIEKGSRNGTVTDNEGRFRLSVADERAVLVFSFIGYQPSEVTVGSQSEFDIRLQTDVTSLDEVVVVGYGTVKKSDLTGAVSSVDGKEIKSVPVVALDRAMQGRAAGVLVTSNSARPGGSTTIRIRGTGSVNASNEPLYVIDGYPTGDLNSINPSDIESIEILKDASSTAIYGSRGSNGVVLVTTKRGTTGRSEVNFESYYGFQSVRKKIDLLNAQEYTLLVNEARINNGAPPYFDGSAPDRPLPENVGEGTDWQDEVFQSAPIQNYQLTFSGGESKTRYSLGFNYFDQGGIVRNSYFKRYSVRANVDREVSDRIRIGLSLQGALTKSNAARTETDGGGSGGVTNAAINFAPVLNVFNPDGSYNRYQGPLNGSLVDNPLALANEITDLTYANRIIANTFVDVRITKDLIFRTSLGGNVRYGKNNYYATRRVGLGASVGGDGAVSTTQELDWLAENTLSYSKTWQERHSINALIGYTYQANDAENVTARGRNFTDDFASYNNLGSGATLVAASSGASEWRLISYLARINYGFNDRYLVTLTARRDGSSRFGPNNKFGFFPSGAIAWKVTNESFMAAQNAVSDLKVRASYGLTGNQEIGNYQYLTTLANTIGVFGNPSTINVGSVPARITNPDLQWEKNAQFDAGLDIGLMNNRIQVTADYYVKVTSDLLFNVNVPQTSGYSNSLQNIGQVENKGVEVSVTGMIIDNSDFKWRSDFNIAFNENRIRTLDGRTEFTGGEGSGHLQVANTVLLKVGEPLGSFYGRVVDGVFQNQEEIDASAQPAAKPGDFRYRDIVPDGVINDNDRTIIGNGYPKTFGGFNNTFTYKGIELNIFLQGSYGNDILNFGRFDLLNLNGNNNQSREVLNRWTPENPSNEVPRANAGGGQRILSTFHVEDGSYLRLKNISLSYNLPEAILEKAYLRTARIYVSAQNYVTLTRYKGYDPEVSRFGTTAISQGMDYGGYPAAKTILIGMNLTF